ncbi:MAG: hypothetical protein ABJ308_17800 [Halieaceae bacterium]
MELSKTVKIHTLLQRELQEYRNSLLITPLTIGGLLLLLMLGSVLFAGRLAIMGDGVMHMLMSEDSGSGVNISINIDDDSDTEIVRQELLVSPEGGLLEPAQELIIIEEPDAGDAEDWNFSGEWSFSPPHRQTRTNSSEEEEETLNPVLNGVHMLFLFIMFIVSINFLLGTLYQDRKDRSILFWKSMPVSEWEEVLSKLAIASLVVPLVFLAVSIVTQLISVLLAMLLVWRMDGHSTEVVLGNIQFVPLILNQLGGMVVWILWTLPVYAWLLLASAAAKRSPFMLGFAIPLGLVFIETVFIGSSYVLSAIGSHIPRMINGDDTLSMGFYAYGPVWSSLDYVGMLLGVGFAALVIAGAVWLRRHRFEL